MSLQLAAALILALSVWEHFSRRTPDNMLLTCTRCALSLAAFILLCAPDEAWALTLAFYALAAKMLEKFLALNCWRIFDRRRRRAGKIPRRWRAGDLPC